MDAISGVITTVILIYVLLSALLTALPTRKRHWMMALVRTGIIILSAVIAVPLSKTVGGVLGATLLDLLESSLPSDIIAFMEEVSLIGDSFELMIALLAAPLIFIVLFLVIRLFFSVVAWIVERVVPGLRDRSTRNTLIAMPIGAVNGILVALITLIPLCGYLTLATDTVEALNSIAAADEVAEEREEKYEEYDKYMSAPGFEQLAFGDIESETKYGNDYDKNDDKNDDKDRDDDSDEEMDELIEAFEDIAANPAINTVNVVGAPLFDWMTTGTLKSGDVKITFSFNDELPHIGSAIGEMMDAAERLEDGEVSEKDKKVLTGALEHLLESDWIAMVVADSLGYMSDCWLAGESFLSVNPPRLNDMLQPVMNTALEVLSTESPETLREDVITVTDILTDLMIAGFLEGNVDYEKMLAALGNDGLLNDLLKTLEENEHMAPLADELRTLSVRVVSSVLGDTLKNTDEYDGLIDDMANELNDVLDLSPKKRKEVIAVSVKDAFANYDVDLPEDVAIEMSEKAIEELGKDGVIESDELKDYLVNNIDDGLGYVEDETINEGIDDFFGEGGLDEDIFD
ncbi:MAG: hypothetical protein E7661_07975 [Ruminococcaceae bacterium]|nr:hypothetical protein [Oscillospiraceae bacterium]